MSEEFFPDDGADYSPKGSHRELIDGIHHVKLIATEKNKIERGPDTLVGNEQIVWKFRVMEGPSADAMVWFSTPLGGYVLSKKNPGLRIKMWDFTRKIISALDPTWTNFASFDREALVGRECEINLQTKKNQDGTTSLWAAKILWSRPWVDLGSSGQSVVAQDTPPDDVHF